MAQLSGPALETLTRAQRLTGDKGTTVYAPEAKSKTGFKRTHVKVTFGGQAISYKMAETGPDVPGCTETR